MKSFQLAGLGWNELAYVGGEHKTSRDGWGEPLIEALRIYRIPPENTPQIGCFFTKRQINCPDQIGDDAPSINKAADHCEPVGVRVLDDRESRPFLLQFELTPGAQIVPSIVFQP